MSNRRDIQFTFSPHNKLTLLDCSFIVDSANGNGLGIRSLKGSGRVANVYMNSAASFVGTTHTGTNVVDSITGGTASLAVGMKVQTTDLVAGVTIASITSSSAITLSHTATTGHAGATITYQDANNPQPPAGYIIVQLSDNYNRYLGGSAAFASPASGSAILVASAGTTAGTAYIIVSVGTTTAAGWQSLGLPANINPAVGVSFIATTTGTASGTGAVEVPLASGAGVFSVEVIGDPNLMNSNGAYTLGQSEGMTIMCACYNDSSGDAPEIVAPADGSVCGMQFWMNNSAQGV